MTTEFNELLPVPPAEKVQIWMALLHKKADGLTW
jgi:hypothetical protein